MSDIGTHLYIWMTSGLPLNIKMKPQATKATSNTCQSSSVANEKKECDRIHSCLGLDAGIRAVTYVCCHETVVTAMQYDMLQSQCSAAITSQRATSPAHHLTSTPPHQLIATAARGQCSSCSSGGASACYCRGSRSLRAVG